AASFRTWMTRIVVNQCLMAIRKPWRRAYSSDNILSDRKPPLDCASNERSPEESTWSRQLEAAHDRAMRCLHPQLRDAYSLSAISGMSLAEVAADLGITVAAAKTRLFRARSAMRVSLK